MEDYELAIGTIKHYRNRACELAKCNCDKCEASYMYCFRNWCCFDTVIRFIEWDNKYNK